MLLEAVPTIPRTCWTGWIERTSSTWPNSVLWRYWQSLLVPLLFWLLLRRTLSICSTSNGRKPQSTPQNRPHQKLSENQETSQKCSVIFLLVWGSKLLESIAVLQLFGSNYICYITYCLDGSILSASALMENHLACTAYTGLGFPVLVQPTGCSKAHRAMKGIDRVKCHRKHRSQSSIVNPETSLP